VLTSHQVHEVLVGHLGVDPTRLLGGARLNEDLGLDSLALTEALILLEDELAISIPDPVQANLLTLDDLLAAVAFQVTPSAQQSMKNTLDTIKGRG